MSATVVGQFLIAERSLLWNPTTKKYKTLPDFRPIYGNIYGFGYGELHDDYKVVGISRKYNKEGSRDIEVKVYSLKSDSWTSVDACGEILNGSCRKMILNGSGLFANGKLHWQTIIAGPNFSNARKGRDIISFDLTNEKWEKMEKPSYGVNETDLCMGTFGSDLCVFSYYKGLVLGL
ncbi:hypothetical protein BC332_33969 [Capsicum chinense]|nr:hypothetical protein BC332_33969 [Capsicum chinense]